MKLLCWYTISEWICFCIFYIYHVLLPTKYMKYIKLRPTGRVHKIIYHGGMGRWFYFAVYIFLKGYVFINFINFINSGSKVYEVDKTYAHQNYRTNHKPRRNSWTWFQKIPRQTRENGIERLLTLIITMFFSLYHMVKWALKVVKWRYSLYHVVKWAKPHK